MSQPRKAMPGPEHEVIQQAKETVSARMSSPIHTRTATATPRKAKKPRTPRKIAIPPTGWAARRLVFGMIPSW
jgi:hypothetical protein